MTTLHGFELLKEAAIPEISSRVRLFRHIKTGAELLSVENADENKSFGVALQTPAPDDTGLPHILEHAVLAGSQKYPLKEPFGELIKTSLASFINAITFPDMTIYPVASTNTQDFYNLIDVYLDAVFFPLIEERTFQQEGWHYELAPDGKGLIYNGIVFNEMKGYYSSPEILMQSLVPAKLMPDTPYAHESGGDPAHIPDLTYEQFRQFHATYYQPSNARFFFYGDDDPEERLRRIDAVISRFEARPVSNPFGLQPRFNAPQTIIKPVDAGDSPESALKALITVNWLLGDVTNTRELMALTLLNNILIGTPAAPLTVALLESGLGEDLTGDGLSPYSREALFSVGMKGVEPDDAPAVEELILETLARLAGEGIHPDTITAAINTVEFELRERNTGRLPRGLAVFMGMLPVWMHGGDPVQALAFEADLNAVKAAYAANPRFFEGLIERYLLNNPHRVTLILQPDANVRAQREAAERQRLEEVNRALTDADRAQIAEQVAALKAYQAAQDSPEKLALLPTLKLSDIDRKIKTIPTEHIDLDGVPLLYHNLDTNGVIYLDLAFDLRGLPPHLVPFVSLFSKALTELGTEAQDFITFQNRIGAHTGGINAGEAAYLHLTTREPIIKLMVRAKAMRHKADDLLAILRDVLLNINFDHRERFRQMILEEKAQFESYLGVYGQRIAGLRLRGQFDLSGWFTEQTSGIAQLFFLREMAKRLETDWYSILATFNTIRDYVMNRAALIVNLTTDHTILDELLPRLRGFVAGLPTRSLETQAWPYEPTPRHEGLAVVTQVNFVGKGANFFDLGYQLHGSHFVILNHFNMDYMFSRIRLQGGAYGGSLSLNPITGVGTFLSWQDPNIRRTLDAYDAAGAYLKSLELSPTELERAQLGTFGTLDAYLLPDAKGMSALVNHLVGNTDELRQQRRDEVFSTTLADFRRFGEVLEAVAREGAVVVVSSEDRLKQANVELDPPLAITKVQ
ncbi:MAG: insulinase family protein [Anaerolineae bacterium]